MFDYFSMPDSNSAAELAHDSAQMRRDRYAPPNSEVRAAEDAAIEAKVRDLLVRAATDPDKFIMFWELPFRNLLLAYIAEPNDERMAGRMFLAIMRDKLNQIARYELRVE
jgi:hypothetical protein